MNYASGPIVACSTCLQGNAGLAVLRLSGFDSLDSLQSFFDKPVSKFTPRKQIHLNLLSNTKEVLDDVLVTYFPTPFSFTGENVLEISLHGNIVHVERIISFIVNQFSFSRAQPGEFTYRAFKNGKLNLAQVEGLDLLLSADSNFLFEQGLSQLNGELYLKYHQLYKSLLEFTASVELSIDFSDDVGEEQIKNLQHKHLKKIHSDISHLEKRCLTPIGSLLEPSIVLYGLPNAGKSTVFNYLVADERSIVSSIEGTTRDYISESLLLDLGRVRLIDTAGLRDGVDVIEQEGIKRSHFQINNAFFKILIVNPHSHFENKFNDVDIDLIIFTHADTPDFKSKFSNLRSQFSASIPMVLWGQVEGGSMGADRSSGPMGANIDFGSIGAQLFDGSIGPDIFYGDILHIINTLAGYKYDILTKNKPVLVARQRELIIDLSVKINKFVDLFNTIDDIAVISSELSLIVNVSQELIGVFTPDDVLHHIFNNFCIGK